MDEPTKDVIDRLKEKHIDRSLHMVEVIDGDRDDDRYVFLMTGANKEEWRKYTDDVLSAKEAKDDKARAEKLQGAVESAVLAQIRWPDRDEVRRIFNAKPAMVQNFIEELSKAAGANAEVRSKKL